MGLATARAQLCNPRDVSKRLKLELLVDTCPLYIWVKRSRLEKLGVEPMGRRRFRTNDGRVVERDIGEAVVECLSGKATTIVVFAEESDNEVLSLHALEGLGMNPATQAL